MRRFLREEYYSNTILSTARPPISPRSIRFVSIQLTILFHLALVLIDSFMTRLHHVRPEPQGVTYSSHLRAVPLASLYVLVFCFAAAFSLRLSDHFPQPASVTGTSDRTSKYGVESKVSRIAVQGSDYYEIDEETTMGTTAISNFSNDI